MKDKAKETEKIREALKKDFNTLYQKGFTTDWKAQRIVRGIEINIMGLDALESLFNSLLANKLREVKEHSYYSADSESKPEYWIDAAYLDTEIKRLEGE